MKEIGYAVIGSGWIGDLLCRCAADLPYARCVATADVIRERAQALAAACGGKAYTDYVEMLDKETPDVVIVATPEPDHRKPVEAAAQRGCHVFCEKPIAMSLEDADAIIEACGDARVKLMVGHLLRFEIQYAMAKVSIDEGRIGRILSMYGRNVASIKEHRRLRGRVNPNEYIGVHQIDLMLWYHPVPVKSVYAKAVHGRAWEEVKSYDLAWMMIEFADGAVGVHEVGMCLPETWASWEKPSTWGAFGDVRFNVKGTDGVLDVNFTPMSLFSCDADGWKLPDTEHYTRMHGKNFGCLKNEVQHYFECILYDKEPLVTGEDGKRAMEVMLAAEQSIAEGVPISLPLRQPQLQI